MPYRSFWKKLIFAAVPTVVALLLATAILTWLETREMIQTDQPDNWVIALPVDWLIEEKTDRGIRWKFNNHYMVPESFLKEKAKDTFRVVITGGSFVMGALYNWVPDRDQRRDGGIPSWLREELKLRYPGKQIEVINAGAAANGSGNILQVFSKMLEADPDVVLVATGNNEGFVPFSSINSKLNRWILYRSIKKALFSRKPRERPYYTFQDPDNQKIEEYYKNNITKIVEEAKENQCI